MRPAPAERPFDSPEWIFEVKYDGLRAFACCDGRNTVLLSAEGKPYTAAFPILTRCVADALGGVPAVLDGEIVYLDGTGRPRYRPLAARKRPQHFYAFDLLMLNHEDLRQAPLYERKNLLADIIAGSRFVRYARHVPERGIALFEAACSHDLEGIVAKWRHGAYAPGGRSPSWLALPNQSYSQARRRRRRTTASSPPPTS